MTRLFKDFKPTAFGILFFILAAVGLATWFIPAGEYTYQCENGSTAFVYIDEEGNEAGTCPTSQMVQNELILAYETNPDNISQFITQLQDEQKVETAVYEYQEIAPKRQGLWNIAQAPVEGFIEAIEIIAFVFVIGGFINIVIKSGAMDSGVHTLLNKFKGKELILIPILMTLFAIGGTTFGMAEETIVFYIILIPVLYRAGFDNLVGMMIIGLGAGVGTLAGTINPFAIGVASEAAGISPGAGIIGRFIFWLILLVITIVYVMNYAKKVLKDPTKSATYYQKEELDQEFLEKKINQSKLNKGQSIILIIMALAFVLMILSVVPWESAFNLNIFNNLTDSINNLSIPFLGGDEGIISFGNWYFVEMTTLFLVASVAASLVAKSFNLIEGKMMPVFLEGAKDMMSVAFVIALARGIQIILVNSGMSATLLYYGTQLLSGLPKTIFAVLTYLLYIPLSFLIPSSSGLATATMPIIGDLASSIFGNDNGKVVAISAYCAASGLVNLITPTSGVVMAALSLSKVELKVWIKKITPLLIILFLLTILFLVLTTTLNFFG